MKQKHFIDIHKGITPLFILFLITYYNSWSNPAAMIYLALHGVYGILWISKSYIFPDKQWEQSTGVAYGLFIWMGLSLYWISPFIIISGTSILPFNIKSSFIYFSICIAIYIIGVFLHFVSDMQKYVYLKLNPSNLIENEMFAKIRNTNYLGEFCIYLGFSLLALDWIPIIVILLFMILIWIPNMNNKDKSLSRYSKFEDYKKRTSKMFPFIY